MRVRTSLIHWVSGGGLRYTERQALIVRLDCSVSAVRESSSFGFVRREKVGVTRKSLSLIIDEHHGIALKYAR